MSDTLPTRGVWSKFRGSPILFASHRRNASRVDAVSWRFSPVHVLFYQRVTLDCEACRRRYQVEVFRAWRACWRRTRLGAGRPTRAPGGHGFQPWVNGPCIGAGCRRSKGTRHPVLSWSHGLCPWGSTRGEADRLDAYGMYLAGRRPLVLDVRRHPGRTGRRVVLSPNHLLWTDARWVASPATGPGAFPRVYESMHVTPPLFDRVRMIWEADGPPSEKEEYLSRSLAGPLGPAVRGLRKALKEGASGRGGGVVRDRLERCLSVMWRPPSRGRPSGEGVDPTARPSDVRIARVMAFLRDHLADPVRLERLGEQAGLSSRQVRRVFRAHAGVPLKDWLKRVRLDRAQALLLADPSALVEVVARQTGFLNGSHLARHFRKRFGSVPKHWRPLS